MTKKKGYSKKFVRPAADDGIEIVFPPLSEIRKRAEENARKSLIESENVNETSSPESNSSSDNNSDEQEE
jgi:hypothetical protein